MEQKDCLQLKCGKHDLNIRYFQVKGIENNKKDQSLFFCLDCIDEHKQFDSYNCFQFKKFINSNLRNQINSEWPPWINQEFLKKYIQLSLSEEDIGQYENQIIKFYHDFKDEINKLINKSMKEQLEEIRKLKVNKQQLIDKCVGLTRIDELKNILLSFSINTVDEIEEKYKELLINVQSKSSQIKAELTIYLSRLRNDKIFDSKKANQMKQQIISNISDINFLIPQNISVDPFYQNIFSSFQFAKHDQNFYIIEEKYVEDEISRNESNEIIIESKQIINGSQRIVSENIFNSDNSYIFRMQIQSIQNGEDLYIGVLFNKEVDLQNKTIIFNLKYDNNQISFNNENSPAFKQENGEGLILSEERIIEMRVNLKQEILEFTDYPHYKYKISIKDDHKQQLKHKNQRLYFSLRSINQVISLRESYIVDHIQ